MLHLTLPGYRIRAAVIISFALLLSAARASGESWLGVGSSPVLVRFTSQPPGARVHHVQPDGTRRYVGATTSLTKLQVPAGEHTFTFELEGYRPVTVTRAFTEKSEDLDPVLEKPLGRVVVRGLPRDGWVRVDDNLEREGTPGGFTLSPGDHRLQFGWIDCGVRPLIIGRLERSVLVEDRQTLTVDLAADVAAYAKSGGDLAGSGALYEARRGRIRQWLGASGQDNPLGFGDACNPEAYDGSGLPTRQAVAAAVASPTTPQDFEKRFLLLKGCVLALEERGLASPVSVRQVDVLESLSHVNVRKACLRIDDYLGKVKPPVDAVPRVFDSLRRKE